MRPTVLVLDDLHWADESTSLLIEQIAGRLDDMSLLIVGTYRDSELDVGEPFARVLDRLARIPKVQRLSLRRLPPDNVRDLLSVLGGQPPPAALVSLIARESEGVPLFAQELFRHLNEEGLLFDAEGNWKDGVAFGKVRVPEGIRLVIGRRIERVSAAARDLLTVASVLGGGFSIDLLGKLAKMDEDAMFDALEEAERAHLLVSSSGGELRYRFAHEMVRQTLLETVSAVRRQRLHLGAAEALEDCRPDQLEERIPELAYHLYQARERADGDKILRFTQAAGDRARRAGAFAEAERDYRRALEFAGDDSIRASILFRLALVVRAVLGSAAAIDVFRDAVEAAPLAEQRWRGEVEMARSQLQLNLFDEAYETATKALEASIPARARGILLVIRAAVGAHAAKDQQGCEEDFRAGLELLADPIGSFSFGLTYACEWYVPEKALELLPAAETFRAFAPPANLHEGLRYAANAHAILGHLDEAMSLSEEALAVATRHGDQFGQGIAKTFLADFSVIKGGDVRGYAELADERRAWLNASLPAWSHAKWRPEWLAGQWERAVAGLTQELNEGLPLARRWAEATLARVLVALGDHRADDLLASIQRAELPGAGVPLHYTTGTWLMHATEAMASSGLPWDWSRVLELCEIISGRGVVSDTAMGDIALWTKTAGIAAACMGDWERAETHFQVATQQAEDIGHLIEQAEVRRWHGWALLLRNEPRARQHADVLLQAAIHRFETLGMPRHAALVADFLERSNVGVR